MSASASYEIRVVFGPLGSYVAIKTQRKLKTGEPLKQHYDLIYKSEDILDYGESNFLTKIA